MKIIDELKELANEICDNYCKYPEQFADQDLMIETVCENCPLVKKL